MKKLFYLFLFFSLAGFAQNSELFEQANAAYAEENYGEAIERYEQILAEGETAVAVHFNLGNSYYKLDRVAPSIYHFEKALQLDPTDEDVRNNLTFARTMAIDAIEDPETAGIAGFFERSTSMLDTEEWAWIGIFCMLLFVIFFLGYYFSRKPVMKRILFICGMLFILLSITSVTIGFSRENIHQSESFAIVFAEETEVRSEPNNRSSEVFSLHEGARVEVMEEFRQWARIRLPNGSQGWIFQEDIKRL